MPQALRTMMTGGLKFDGVNDYVSVPDSASLRISGDIAIVLWLNMRGVPSSTTSFLHKGTCPNPIMYAFSTYTGTLWHYVVLCGVTNGYLASYTNTIPLNVWSHWAVVRNGSFLGVYRNGVLIQSRNDLSGSATLSTENVEIGRQGGIYINAIINDVRLYNISLSSTNVQQLYQGTYTNTTGLVLWISAQSWNGTHFVDLSGNGNHGTPYGNVQYKVWTQNGFSTTYVGDPTDPAFTSAVYGAFLEYSSASVNVAPKVGVATSFNWTHPVYGSTGNFTFAGNGTYVHYVTINGTNLFTRVVPIGYLTGSYYAVQVYTITAPSQYPLVYSISGCNLTGVNYASQSLSITTEAPSGAYGIITIYSPSEPWQVWKGDITLQPISYSQLGLTDGYCYYGASRMLYVSVRHSSPVTIVINYQEAPVTGGSGSGGGLPDKSSQTAPISVVTLPSISISSIAVPTVLLVLAAATAAAAAIAFRGRGQRGGRKGKGGRGR